MDPEVTTELVAAAAKAAVKVAAAWAKVAVAVKVVAVVAASMAMAGLVVGVEVVAAASRRCCRWRMHWRCSGRTRRRWTRYDTDWCAHHLNTVRSAPAAQC